MSIGQAYPDALTPHEQQALQASCDILIDSIFDDLQNIKEPEDVAHTMLGIYLPERYLYKYTPFAKVRDLHYHGSVEISATRTHSAFLFSGRIGCMSHYPRGKEAP